MGVSPVSRTISKYGVASFCNNIFYIAQENLFPSKEGIMLFTQTFILYNEKWITMIWYVKPLFDFNGESLKREILIG